MYRIDCQNQRQANGKEVECERYMVSIPESVLTLLRAMQDDPEAKIITRCPSCGKGRGRFSEIRYVKDKLTFRTIEGTVDLGKPVIFDDVFVMAEGGA